MFRWIDSNLADKPVLVGSLTAILAACHAGGTAELGSEMNDLLTEIPGNPTCADLGYGDTEVKQENPAGGEVTYDLGGGGEFTIFHDLGSNTFDWESNIGIDAVIVKGGPNANVYDYAPEAFEDSGLLSPLNGGGQVPAISHISICFDLDPCDGVVCDEESECAEAGVCNPNTGACEYEPKDCSDPCEDVQCDGETACAHAGVCNPDTGACEYQPKDQGTLCREAAGVCDLAEFCDGQSTECPADELELEGVECGGADSCGHPNICSGDSVECPDHADSH